MTTQSERPVLHIDLPDLPSELIMYGLACFSQLYNIQRDKLGFRYHDRLPCGRFILLNSKNNGYYTQLYTLNDCSICSFTAPIILANSDPTKPFPEGWEFSPKTFSKIAFLLATSIGLDIQEMATCFLDIEIDASDISLLTNGDIDNEMFLMGMTDIANELALKGY
jgi:hypothetical protein